MTVAMQAPRNSQQASSRSRDDFEVGGGGFVATGATNEDVDRSFEFVRKRVGFYGSTPSYWPVLELHDQLEPATKKESVCAEIW